MSKQIYDKGQIVWYIGPDLVTYKKEKTYTVLGYNKKFDMYGVMSDLDDEIYMLPEEALKPLSEDEKKTIRISDRMYEYYNDDSELSYEELTEVDEERKSAIIKMAKDDIKNNRLKRDREEFSNDLEYRIYLSNLAGEVDCLKHNLKQCSSCFFE